MQIQVFMGSAGDGNTSKLQAVQDRLELAGVCASIIHAGAYGEDGLLEILEVRAVGGQRAILVDDCSRQQILRVLEWQSCIEHEPYFDDLVIHLARKDRL
ncbi:hypothetical protein [Pseudomonas fluorescens]